MSETHSNDYLPPWLSEVYLSRCEVRLEGLIKSLPLSSNGESRLLDMIGYMAKAPTRPGTSKAQTRDFALQGMEHTVARLQKVCPEMVRHLISVNMWHIFQRRDLEMARFCIACLQKDDFKVFGADCLEQAVFGQDVPMVELLLSSGLDLNSGYRPKWTFALSPKTSNFLPLFLKHGANFMLKDKEGMTALHFLAIYCLHEKDLDKCKAPLNFILDQGVDIHARETFGATARDLAKSAPIGRLFNEYIARHNAKVLDECTAAGQGSAVASRL